MCFLSVHQVLNLLGKGWTLVKLLSMHRPRPGNLPLGVEIVQAQPNDLNKNPDVG